MRTVAFILLAFGAMAGGPAAVPVVRVGPNMQVSAADAPRPQYEVQVCADPDHAGSLMVVAMAAIPKGRFVTQVYVSSDDGQTWQRTFEENAALNSFDPSCAYGRNNESFFLTIGFPGDEPRTNTSLLRSTDGGRTWTRMNALARSVDRPYLAVDRSRGLRDGQLYIDGKRDRRTVELKPDFISNLWVARTSDGGKTFSQFDAPSPLAEVYAGQAVVLRDGTFVTVFGKIYDDLKDPRNSVTAVRSLDGAASIQAPVRIADWHVPQNPNQGAGFTLAADNAQDIYTAWEDDRAGHTAVMFSASNDGGATWNRPLDVTSLDASTAGGFNPAIAVNRWGVIGLLWYDKRRHPSDLGWGIRFAISLDRRKTFQPSVKVSEKDAVPGRGLGREGRFSANGGDTSGLAAEPDGAFRAVWIDNRTGVPQIWTSRLAVTSP